jgi:hypothetical protein
MDPAPQPTELATLRELVVTLNAALAAAQQENTLLRQKIDALVRRVFGASSERLDPAQLELLLQPTVLVETPPTVAVVAVPKIAVSRPRKERAPRLPENLPVIEEVLEPEAGERSAIICTLIESCRRRPRSLRLPERRPDASAPDNQPSSRGHHARSLSKAQRQRHWQSAT